MLISPAARSVGVSLAMGLSACSGSSGTGESVFYEPLTRTSGFVSLSGTGIRSELSYEDGIYHPAGIVQTSGQLNAASGGIRLDDGFYAFSGPDGPEAGIIFDDDDPSALYKTYRGTASTDTDIWPIFTDTYAYVEAYYLVYYGANNAIYRVAGLHGSATTLPDMQGSGNGLYAGEAIISLGPESCFRHGKTVIDADFSHNTASVNISYMASSDSENPVSQIRLQNMIIRGNQLEGGSISVTPADAMSDYSREDFLASGQFFGYNQELQRPEEVGGVFVSHGADGQLEGFFLAKAGP